MRNSIVWIIDNWKNLIACFFEILMIMFCIHSVFKEKLRVSLFSIGLVVFDLTIMSLIAQKILGSSAACMVYIMLLVYCIVKFKRKFLETVGYFISSFVVIALTEIVASLLAIPLIKILGKDENLMLLINMIAFLLVIITSKLLQMRKKKFHLKIDIHKWGALILVCGLCLAFMIVDCHLRGKVDQIYYFVFLILCILVYVYTLQMQGIKHELEKRKLEWEMKEIYGDAYKELIFEVRRKQHDFINQLAAIYSMHLTANSLEDLIEKQREYSDVLLEECRYDKILTGCNNPILAGYLYYKCVNYGKNDVIVEYQVCVENAFCRLSLHEVIEILGILLTNAYESVETGAEEKKIKLVVQESTDNLIIEVSNIAQELTTKEIEKIFEKGYSSKGENRGIGLSRVKQLASKSLADIIVANRESESKNWVSFQVVIPKTRG